VVFNVVAKNTIVDLAPRVAELKRSWSRAVILAHSTRSEDPGSARPERAELVAGPHYRQLDAVPGQMYPYVLVDANHA